LIGETDLSGIFPDDFVGWGFLDFDIDPAFLSSTGAGLCLLNFFFGDIVNQTLAYGTVDPIFAQDGPCLGARFDPIAVNEAPDPSGDQSLQLVGRWRAGDGRPREQFEWSGPLGESRGLRNAGQCFTTNECGFLGIFPLFPMVKRSRLTGACRNRCVFDFLYGFYERRGWSCGLDCDD
jgi:hypothetical protein